MTKNSFYIIIVLAIVNTITSCISTREYNAQIERYKALNDAYAGIIACYYNNYDENHEFFLDAISETDYFVSADSILNGNWEHITNNNKNK